MSSPAVSAGQLAGRVEHKRFSEARTFSRYETLLLHRIFYRLLMMMNLLSNKVTKLVHNLIFSKFARFVML